MEEETVLTTYEGKSQVNEDDDGPLFTNDGTVYSLPTRIEALDIGALPHSYKSNSTKEELALEYVENFRRQYVGIFPNRAPLFLFPKNECGIRKLICSTIRPTQLPYKELYDIRSCSQFVAGFLNFEPLADPFAVPKIMPSPTMILDTQVADSFGFACVLTSFLIGSGYDAYVVSGYAPQWMTLRVESWKICPMLEEDILKASDGSDATQKSSPRSGARGSASKASSKNKVGDKSVYDLAPQGIPKSQYIEMLEAKAKEEEEATKRRKEQEGDLIEEYENDGNTKVVEIDGKKLAHAWVMIAPGKRGITDAMFVEVSISNQ